MRNYLKKVLCSPLQEAKKWAVRHQLQRVYRALNSFENALVGGSFVNIWEFVHRDGGKILGRKCYYNSLANQGQADVLDNAFRNQSAATGFEVALFNDTPAKTDTPTDLTGECAGNGYARIALARNTTDWPSLALDSGDYKVTSKQITFTASGGSIGPFLYACLITTNATKRLWSYAPVNAGSPRTLQASETLDVIISEKLIQVS